MLHILQSSTAVFVVVDVWRRQGILREKPTHNRLINPRRLDDDVLGQGRCVESDDLEGTTTRTTVSSLLFALAPSKFFRSFIEQPGKTGQSLSFASFCLF